MKKTLVAVAALAAFGSSAFAQSTANIYGRIDLTVQSRTETKAGVKTAGGNRGWEVNSAGMTGSRWGIKAVEDLGGGLSAMANVESGFNPDVGSSAQGGLLFGRTAIVGLSGGFGTFTAGRQNTPLDGAWYSHDPLGQGVISYAWTAGVGGNVGRKDSSLLYKTPAMGGFSAQVMVAPGENKVPGVQSASSFASLAAAYRNGPLAVDFGYENDKVNVAVPRSSSTLRSWVLGAGYDFGVAKLYGAFEQGKKTGFKDTGWTLGVGIPFGAFAVNFGYATEKHDDPSAFDGRSSAFGGQVVYSLSKRTSVYANALSGKARPAGAGAATTKNSLFGVGMRHDF